MSDVTAAPPLVITPTISIDFTLPSDFSAEQATSAMSQMSDAASQIAGKLLVHKQAKTSDDFIAMLMNASQLLAKAVELINGPPPSMQQQIARPMVLPPGMRRMN